MIAMKSSQILNMKRVAYGSLAVLMVLSLCAHIVMVFFYAKSHRHEVEAFRGASTYETVELDPTEYADNLARIIAEMRESGIDPARQYFDVPASWHPPEGWQAPEGWEAPEWWPDASGSE